MIETTELIELPPQESALSIYSTDGGLDPLIQQISEKVSGTVYDMATAKGRDECRSDAAKVARSKTAIEKLGKMLSAEYKEVPKKIDAERRRAFDVLEELQKQVRAPLTEWEEADKQRIQNHRDAMDWMESVTGVTADEISAAIAEVEQMEMGEMWEEFAALAASTKDKALARLRAALVARQKDDADQTELERLRAEAAERDRKDREAAIAKKAADDARAAAEAEATAKRDDEARRVAAEKAAADKREADLKLAAQQAENAKLLAQQQAAQAIIDADQRIKDAAAAEEKRRADEAAEIERATKAREADEAHRASVNRAALEALMKGKVPEECAKLALKLIANGRIPAVAISY